MNITLFLVHPTEFTNCSSFSAKFAGFPSGERGKDRKTNPTFVNKSKLFTEETKNSVSIHVY